MRRRLVKRFAAFTSNLAAEFPDAASRAPMPIYYMRVHIYVGNLWMSLN